MGWPDNARYLTHSPGGPVDATTINEVQDKIVDLHVADDALASDINDVDVFARAARWISASMRHYPHTAAQDAYWSWNGDGYWHWDSVGAESANPGTGPNLWLPLPIMLGRIDQIKWKFKASTDGLASIVLHLWRYDKLSVTDAPASASAKSKSLASGFTADVWQVATFSGLPLALDPASHYAMFVAGASESNGDCYFAPPLIQIAAI